MATKITTKIRKVSTDSKTEGSNTTIHKQVKQKPTKRIDTY